MAIIPCFASHYSIGSSILTLDSLDDIIDDGPESIIKICLDEGIKDLYLCDSNMSGFVSAYKNSEKAKLDLRFGLKIVLCNDMTDKNPESLNTESKVIIWIKSSKGYEDLIKLYSIGATEGFYHRPRVDTNFLRKNWNGDNLMLTIPYYYSFLHRNLLYGANCRPDFSFTKPGLHREKNSLPFNYLIDKSLETYALGNKLEILDSKSIYYRNRKDFLYFLAYKCMHERTTLEKPNLNHLASDEFCFESWREENE